MTSVQKNQATNHILFISLPIQATVEMSTSYKSSLVWSQLRLKATCYMLWLLSLIFMIFFRVLYTYTGKKKMSIASCA